MKRTKKELMGILVKRYIQVVLQDGSVHNGYIGNPEDFNGEDMPEEMVLINGLLRDVVHVSDVVDVSFPKREDTTEIPIVDTISMAKYRDEN